MGDADLEQIRRARLQEMQQQQGQSGGQGGEQEQKQQREARASILSQILEPDAADRLGRIRLVKQSRAEDVENRLIMLARSGQLKQKISEAQLKDILAAMSEQQEKKETVKVSRRKGGWDDDDLEDLLNSD
ncbi:DNA-binding TFAR19-related protein [Aureobasidium pullulans EXF-150]|uniref:DNA-binding TFAR19-related protein n=1 Tax=Aureobasidium pullulans EXF-150 TaxID=1043002 RepID=A0A074XVW8_AURPU|nr:DNA-binding TFAR19-related protein [Aureobasidium pullulans EXF-150]KEQ89738.1 DNA-binding TFAR19-related protein [Aureobasidium pullulans EXF-150]